MGATVRRQVENESIPLDGWDMCFVRLSFGAACFVHALPGFRLLAMEHRAMKHWVGNGNVHQVVTTCALPS